MTDQEDYLKKTIREVFTPNELNTANNMHYDENYKGISAMHRERYKTTLLLSQLSVIISEIDEYNKTALKPIIIEYNEKSNIHGIKLPKN